MNATEFRYKCLEAEKALDPQKARAELEQAIAEKTSQECYYPRKMALNLSDLGTMHNLTIRCGKCNFCRSYVQSEWFTRMWHETLASEHVYFVTLTYKQFADYEEVPAVLRNGYYHYDNFNSNHVNGYSPCLVRIEHLQLFHRQLRRLVCYKYKYFCSLEYGSDYGRPHAHLIIWTYNNVLTIGSRKQPVWETIGHVDFVDLNLNGTIQKDIKIDGQHMDAKFAFQYLSKYVNKYEAANYQRVNIFRNDLLNGLVLPTDDEYKAVFSDLDMWLNRLYTDDAIMYINEKSISNEKLLQDKILQVAEDGLLSFSKLFRSRTTCSRAEGIGAVYLQSNIERMVAGNITITDKKYSTLVCPRYYLRKVRETLNPILRRSPIAGSSSYSAQNRPNQVQNLVELLISPFSRVNSSELIKDCNPLALDYLSLSGLLHSPFSFRNCLTHERLIICSCGDILESPVVYGFKFDRHKRCYELTSSFSLEHFIEVYADYCRKSYDYSSKILRNMSKQQQALEAAKDIFDAVFYSTEWEYEKLSPYNDYRSKNVEMLRARHDAYEKDKHDKFGKKIF